MKTNEQFLDELNRKKAPMIPLEPYRGARTKIQFKCLQCGRVIEKTPDSVLQGKYCAACAHTKKLTQSEYEERAKKAHPSIRVIGQYKSTSDIIDLECSICGLKWSTRAGRFLKGVGCPRCNRYIHTSFPEQAVFYYLRSVYPDTQNAYNIGFGKSELDCFIPSLKIGVEYDGKMWHRDKPKSEQLKYDKCKELGIYLIRIREESLSEACDFCVETRFLNRNYSELDTTIRELFIVIQAKQMPDIDTERDQYIIRESYYGARKNKSLANNYPIIADEWFQEKNGLITPSMVSYASNDKYYWKCPQCQFVYRTTIAHRTLDGTGCPKCAGNLKKSNKIFLAEMAIAQPTIEICSEYRSAFEKISCKCLVCNHQWKATADSLRRGEGCPRCANNIRKTQAEFVAEIKAIFPSITVLGEYKNTSTPIHCRCEKCGNEWDPWPLALLRGHGCPGCAGNKKRKVICVETGNAFESAKKAAEWAGVSRSAIQKCCYGRMKTAGGFKWTFSNEN